MYHLLKSLWWWIEVHDGTVHESGPYYGFWSGFGSDFGEYVIAGSLITGIVTTYRRHKCQSCPRLVLKRGKGEVAGTHYETCHKHTNAEHHDRLQRQHRVLFPSLHAHLNKESNNV
jgi:hypothetical protein